VGCPEGGKTMDKAIYRHFQEQRIFTRIHAEALWIIDEKCSIRKCAKEFLMSKSQVHRDMHALRHINDDLYVQVKNILKSHSTR
jgi:putative DeoR family transcriptional regulator (stage III sporulation protein D)